MHCHGAQILWVAVLGEARVEFVREQQVGGLADGIGVPLLIRLLAEKIISDRIAIGKHQMRRAGVHHNAAVMLQMRQEQEREEEVPHVIRADLQL